jgi:transposase
MSLMIKSNEIWAAHRYVDFRSSIDGLCRHIQEYFGANPQKGLYIFYNRARNRLKMLLWHRNGFMLLYKRLERSRFPYRFSAQPSRQLITEQQLKGLLIGLDWQMISNWEEIEFDNYF